MTLRARMLLAAAMVAQVHVACLAQTETTDPDPAPEQPAKARKPNLGDILGAALKDRG